MDFRHRIVILVVAMVALMTIPRPVSGQAPKPYDPLGIPSGTTLRCRATRLATADSTRKVDVLLRFAEGEELRDERMINARFDSSGTPRALSVWATQVLSPSSLETQTHAAVIWFAPNGTTYGHNFALAAVDPRTPTLPAKDSAAASARRIEQLPDTIAERARSLSAWLWQHRCGRAAAPSRSGQTQGSDTL